MKQIPLQRVQLTGGLLAEKQALVRQKVIPYQWKALHDQIPEAEPSHAIQNLRIAAGKEHGDFYGMVFQDSDIAKWLEAVAYTLATHPSAELEASADEIIALLAEAQDKEGYLNTYFTLKEPEKRWTNLAECHELYCIGHFIEAGVAYFQATKKRTLLDCMIKAVDQIDSIFGPEPEKLKGYPGHQEIELALVRLYGVTGKPKHLQLALYFITQRGQQPHYFDIEWEQRGRVDHWPHFHAMDTSYSQSHLPVVEQSVAVGHAVRAVYMYSAMADLATQKILAEVMSTADSENFANTASTQAKLKEACETLWHNVAEKQMYITGGIGSSGHQEAFTFDYDLPNDRAYTETCASIGLIFWAQRMFQLHNKASYIDIMERALYNGVLSGISEDGEKFFYVNPLEVQPEACNTRHDLHHVKPTRQSWFGCACCPPNIARLLASIGGYLYSVHKNDLYVHMYNSSSVTWSQGLTITVETDYPWDETVRLTFSETADTSTATNHTGTLFLRIPGWCNQYELLVNQKPYTIQPCQDKPRNPALNQIPMKHGYLQIHRDWQAGDTVELKLTMPVERVYSNAHMRNTAGKVALQRGPVVYCLEEVDNGTNLPALSLPKTADITAVQQKRASGIMVLQAQGLRMDSTEALYTTTPHQQQPVSLTFVPYYSWNNRGDGEMLVWLRES